MRIFTLLTLFVLVAATCKPDPLDFAQLTAPVAYAVANNALRNNQSDGRFIIELSFQSLRREQNSWPSGTIIALISIPNTDRHATVTYILNGTHIATAIVEIAGEARQQYQVNLVENAIIFGQAQTLESHLSHLCEQLARGLNRSSRIAVFDGESLSGAKPPFGRSIGESMVTNLAQRQLTIVERRLLDQVLREMNFQSSGITGDEVRKRMGQFLGADTIIVSTIQSAREEITINARAIEVESGVVRSSAQIIFPRYLVTQSALTGIE